jgi:phosphate transport system permease protein
MNILFTSFTAFAALVGCGVFIAIFTVIFYRGLPAISFEFLTDQIRVAGASGGIIYNLIGTLILLVSALLVSAPLAIGIALMQTVFLNNGALKKRLELLLYILNGVPSILFGIFGFIVFVKYLELGKSWLTGGFLLGMMILPTVTIALIERIRSIPKKYLEAATGLGLRKSQIIFSVILPQSMSGLTTGSLLGLARAAGETAPIMYTATIFAGATIPTGIKESPVLALPYHIFVLAQDAFAPAAIQNLWGAALVLILLVFMLSIFVLPLRLKIHEEAHHA